MTMMITLHKKDKNMTYNLSINIVFLLIILTASVCSGRRTDPHSGNDNL